MIRKTLKKEGVMPKVQVDSELKEILPTFLKNRSADCVKLNELLLSKDFESLKKLGHKVSGSSGGYGFSELGDIAKKIELSANSKNEEEVKVHIKQFIDYVENIEVEYV